MKEYKLAVIGVTGIVGRNVIKVLEEKKLPISEYVFFASLKSSSQKITFLGKEYTVKSLNKQSFDYGFDYAIFCAGSDVSLEYARLAVSNGTIVIDNSSAFRMDPNVPLVVPEVNPQDIYTHNGIIANPNCSTIQAVVALKPLDDKYGINRIVYSTYQAVSGAGQAGVDDLINTSKGLKNKKFLYSIANNCIPQIDSFLEDGYTKEEKKMIDETRKILHNNRLKITATTVRVPIINCHSESINIEFSKEIDIDQIKEILSKSPGIILQDDISNNVYPLAENANGTDYVYVGRVRRDYSIENGINIWVVADNLRKGAASNAVQILEKLL